MGAGRLRYAVSAVLAAAFAVSRFWRIGDQCLWFDEIFSVHAAEHQWIELLRFVALDIIHPPLFYIILKIWIGIGGDAAVWLRSFSAVFAILSLLPLLMLVKELSLPKWTSAITLLLLTVNGSLLKYSQEVRMYSTLMCISLFSLWLFTRYFNKGKDLNLLIVVNILLTYTHYFGWFVVLTEVAVIVHRQRIKWRAALKMTAIVGSAFLPWVVVVITSASRSGIGQNIGWMSRPALREIVTLLFGLVDPFYFQAVSIEPISSYRWSIPILLIISVSLIIFFVRKAEQTARYLLSAFVAVPVTLAFVLSWILPYSIWGTRHLIIIFGPALALFSLAIASLPQKWLLTASLTFLILFAGAGFITEASAPKPKMPWCNWEGLANEIPEKEPATVYVFEDLIAYQLWYATKDRAVRPRIVKVEGLPDSAEDKAFFLPRGFEEVHRVDLDELPPNNAMIFYRTLIANGNGDPRKALADRGFQVNIVRTTTSQFEIDAVGTLSKQ